MVPCLRYFAIRNSLLDRLDCLKERKMAGIRGRGTNNSLLTANDEV